MSTEPAAAPSRVAGERHHPVDSWAGQALNALRSPRWRSKLLAATGGTIDDVEALLSASSTEAERAIETAFGDAGWYARDAQPYAPPAIPFDAPPATGAPIIEVERRLWLARYNPADPDFDVPDVDDDSKFPWQHPEIAPQDGWWLGTVNTPAGRAAIEEIAVGDLVICQRTDPGAADRDPDDQYRTDMLIGICEIGLVDAWEDADTGKRERRACLIPLAKFTDPVPRSTARVHHRLRGLSFKWPRQLPGRGGPIGFGLSAVDWRDAVELLSVCGISPEALAEPNTALLAARLRASDTGNRLFLRLRYDAVLRDRVRRVHERQAEQRAEAWAALHGYVKRQSFQHVANAGFDLLFLDEQGRKLQIEVKGYAARRLRAVHLQQSQARRAHSAAAGTPPDWRLFALLGAGAKNDVEHVLDPPAVVRLISSGGIQVKGGWAPARP